MQRKDDWSNSYPEDYSRSPPKRHPEPMKNEYNSEPNPRSPQFSQNYRQTGYNNNNSNLPTDNYGPPVTIHSQKQYSDRLQPPIGSRYSAREYSADERDRDPHEYGRSPPSQDNQSRHYEPPPRQNTDNGSP